jgi:membrane protease YdiL (CAAX protease family)
MLKCPNCGLETIRTIDLACQWCGYPLIKREYHWGAIIYLLAITGAEVVTVFFAPLWGIISHIIILVALILHSALASEHRYQRLVLSLALVPLVRVMSLSMPLSGIPQIWWYPIIYAPLLVAAVMVIRLTGYRARDVGLTFKLLPLQLAIALTGFLFGIAEYFILAPEAMVAEFTWQEIWLPALLLLVCTGFTEEFIFRGVLQRTAVEAFKGWWGIVYISLLFAVLHMGFLSWIDVVFVFVVALFFGWLVKKTGSLLGVTLSHGITNITLYLVFPFFF